MQNHQPSLPEVYVGKSSKYEVIACKYKQDSEVCNLCSDTKSHFLLKLNTDLGSTSVYLKLCIT